MTCPGKTRQAPPIHIGPFVAVTPSGRRVMRSQLYWLRKYRAIPSNVVRRQMDVFSQIIEINDILCSEAICRGH